MSCDNSPEVVPEPRFKERMEGRGGRGEADFVTHASSLPAGREVVIVFEEGEGTLAYDVAKVDVGAPGVDETGAGEAEAEVPALPGNGIVEAEEAGGFAGDHLHPCLRGGESMEIDAEGELKAALYRGIDESGEPDGLQEVTVVP